MYSVVAVPNGTVTYHWNVEKILSQPYNYKEIKKRSKEAGTQKTVEIFKDGAER